MRKYFPLTACFFLAGIVPAAAVCTAPDMPSLSGAGTPASLRRDHRETEKFLKASDIYQICLWDSEMGYSVSGDLKNTAPRIVTIDAEKSIAENQRQKSAAADAFNRELAAWRRTAP